MEIDDANPLQGDLGYRAKIQKIVAQIALLTRLEDSYVHHAFALQPLSWDDFLAYATAFFKLPGRNAFLLINLYGLPHILKHAKHFRGYVSSD